jgi:hypothetical protein
MTLTDLGTSSFVNGDPFSPSPLSQTHATPCVLHAYVNRVKKEFKLLAGALGVCIGVVISCAIAMSDYEGYVPVLDYVICPLLSSEFIIISAIRPIYHTYQWQKRLKQVGNIGNLSELLTMDGCFDAFLSYCTTEFSSENLVSSPCHIPLLHCINTCWCT